MGIFDKFKLGLSKSSKSLSSGLNNLIFKKKIDENMLDELEDFLIQSVALQCNTLNYKEQWHQVIEFLNY